MESNLFVWNRRVVFCKAYISQIQSLVSRKTCEVIITEGSCNFSCTVRTEVKEDNGILVFYCSDWCSVFHNDSRQNKFICLIIVIRSLDSFHSRFSLYAFALCHGIESQFHTIPAVIAVHCIVTSHNGGNLSYTQFFHFRTKLFHITFAACRRCVSSIQEAVYKNFGQPFSFSQFQKTEYMSQVAVHTAV